MPKNLSSAILSRQDSEWYEKLDELSDEHADMSDVLQFIKHLEDKYPIRNFPLDDYLLANSNEGDALSRFEGQFGYHSANIYRSLCYSLSNLSMNPDIKKEYYEKLKSFLWREITRIEKYFLPNSDSFIVPDRIFLFLDDLVLSGVMNKDPQGVARAYIRFFEMIDSFEDFRKRNPIGLAGRSFIVGLETLIRRKAKDNDAFKSFILRHPKMFRTYTDAIVYAFDDEPCLIIGETGTGKEMVAECIHAFSIRREKPFLTLNCGGLADTLFNDAIQGHVKGAFTDAKFARPGLFLSADRGTLFLDEINSLAISSQSCLLRIIQFGEVQPVGAEHNTKEADVRVICAVNADPLQLIKDGRFREDLYFRIAKGIIQVPPLRELKDGLEEIVHSFIMQIWKGLNPDKKIEWGAKAIRKLREYDWPGNFRELENVLYRALKRMEISNENILKPSHIEDLINREIKKTDVSKRDYSDIKYKDLKKEYLKFICNKTNGKALPAEKLTGMDRITIKRKWKKYGIDRTQNEPK